VGPGPLYIKIGLHQVIGKERERVSQEKKEERQVSIEVFLGKPNIQL